MEKVLALDNFGKVERFVYLLLGDYVDYSAELAASQMLFELSHWFTLKPKGEFSLKDMQDYIAYHLRDAGDRAVRAYEIAGKLDENFVL